MSSGQPIGQSYLAAASSVSSDGGGSNPPIPPYKNLMDDKNSTYFLGTNDQPGNIITPVVLRGSHHDEWSNAITLSLLSRRKIGFLEGSEVKPTDPNHLLDWRVLQATLVQWVMNTIDPKLRTSIP